MICSLLVSILGSLGKTLEEKEKLLSLTSSQ
jgi:hypothetical protein